MLWLKVKWILNFVRRRRADRELAQEVESHLEEKVADLMEAGMPEPEARQKANREFGNAPLYQEISREVWGWIWLEILLQDLHYGLRVLNKNRGFTVVAATTLALGIAVNTSIFSLFSGWVLKRPAVADPDRVVVVVSTNAKRDVRRGSIPAPDFLAWRDGNRVFQNLAIADVYHDVNLTGAREPERVPGMRVSAGYFDVLGIRPMLGRTFLPGEDQPGRSRVAVLSHTIWQRRFASDPQVIGKAVALDGQTYVVIGVMPAEFRLSLFLTQVWTPLVFSPQDLAPQARDARSYLIFARLKTGITIEKARAGMGTLARSAEQNNPASEKGWGANVLTLQEYSIQEQNIRAGLWLLIAAVALVLLIACVNVANLILARGSARRQEIAIRTALGAGRGRVIRQLLVESLLIAALGGAAGLLLAYWGVDLLRGTLHFNAGVSAIADDVALDRRVLAFTWLISMATALVFGLAPAIRVSAADPQTTLRQGGRSGDLRRGWGRHVLVGGEIALAVLLVSGAALMIKALSQEMGGDYGYDPGSVLTADLQLTGLHYQDPLRRVAFVRRVMEKLQALPGVEAVAVSDAIPFDAGKRTFRIQGQPLMPPADRPGARYGSVTPDYFRALGVPLIQGRAFRDSDADAAPPVAIVNRAFARRYFSGQESIGRYIAIDSRESAEPVWREIVGIVPDMKTSFGPLKENDPQMYVPYLQIRSADVACVVRVTGDPNAVAVGLRRAVWSVDPDQPVGEVGTIAHRVQELEGGDRVMNALLGVFAAMALVLAVVGIYGVVSYAVAQRKHEIGIRMALGAQRGRILRSMMGQGMLLATVSAGIGLVASVPLPGIFAAMFQQWRVRGAAIFLYVPLLLLGVVLVAIYIPASRAARTDPMEALRYE